MAQDVAQQGNSQHGSAPARPRRALLLVGAVVLLVVGAAVGVGATAAVRAFGGTSLTDLAVGVWTCTRTGSDGTLKGKVFVGRGTWAVVETDHQLDDGGDHISARFREGGTWKLDNGRLVITWSEGSYTIEEMPTELGRNKELHVKAQSLGGRTTASKGAAVEYVNGRLTLRAQPLRFDCTKDS